jgi:pimeloyl-ACP methyl ester carboxylesterase
MLSRCSIVGLIVCISIAVAAGSMLAAEPSAGKAADGTRSVPATECWKQIAPLFSPPKEFAGDFGRFRTPFGFYNADMVRTAADWQRRRQEILTRWQSLLGKWPPVIEKPKVEIVKTSRRENFVQHQIRFQWLPNEMTEGYLLVPDGEGARPAVLVVYYEPETAIGEGREYRDFAYQLTKRGFVTLSMGNRAGTDAKTYGVYYPSLEKASIQPLSGLAYTAANAYHVLAGRKEVDPQRVGVVGHSFGGKWAMFASCLYDKFACAVWSDPGIVFDSTRGSINYWEPWYLGYEPGHWRKRGMVTQDNPCFGLYPRLLAEGYDLHELHALMAPRPFLVSGGSEDPPRRWRALNHTIRVNELQGYKDRVAMSNRPEHSPNAQSNEQIYSFFEHFLKYGGKKLARRVDPRS